MSRIRHLADAAHRSYSSNNTAISSNWSLAADGAGNVAWTPIVNSIAAAGSNAQSGMLNLQSGSGIAITESGTTFTIAATAAAVSFGSTAADVASTGSGGAASTSSRSDHAHRGVTAVTANGSNTTYGTVNLKAGTNIALGVSGQDVTITSLASGGGGGGSSITDYVSGSSGSGQIVIPGLEGSPDAKPASPNAKDDEFESLSGWTTLGSLNTSNVTDFKSHWHALKNSVGLQIHGIYKAAPATPFTVTAKFTQVMQNGNYCEYGLALGDATPTAWDSVSLSVFPSPWTIQRDVWTNNTTRASSANGTTGQAGGANIWPAKYLRLTVTSTSSVTASYSPDGFIWYPSGLGTLNPGFASQVGIVISANGVSAECVVDWIRFT